MTPAAYHDRTKHHVHRFARSPGFLDWASQPEPFRRFDGAPAFPLVPKVGGADELLRLQYRDLFDAAPAGGPPPAVAVGDSLRHALGLTAWKSFRGSRWSLRANPSSGNLHPTEAYIVMGPSPSLAAGAGVYHYAPDRHDLQLRCAFNPAAWRAHAAGAEWLVVLTSIHWREAWKYGERAFRYCQHDLGHAIAALRLAARLEGRSLALVPEWPQPDIAALVGLDRLPDFADAEPEQAACLLTAGPGAPRPPDRELLDAVRAGTWAGRASRLSREHVDWPAIDEVAAATVDPGRPLSLSSAGPASLAGAHPPSAAPPASERDADARALLVRRRSAVAFDGETSMDRGRFLAMLGRTMPGPHPPWDALWWTPRLHLALFIHRVEGFDPGLYVLPRDPGVLPRLQAACEREFLWEPADAHLRLACLARGDCRRLSAHASCDQAIAGDGCFSVGMLAEFDRSLEAFGPSFYRHLFWESGVIGQVLYLEAEAAGLRGTGIGCFFDDVVHEILGIRNHAFQSLYHFTVGRPVEDVRLTTEPGYPWEARPAP